MVPALFASSGTVGGAERYALELARHMADRVPTTLLTFGDVASEERLGALRVRVLRRTVRVRGEEHNPLAPGVLAEVARADVVHCHQQHVLVSSLTALAARALGRGVFVSDLGGGGWDISAYVSTDRWYHAHLHISRYSRTVYNHADKPWAHVIYGGVDTAKFQPAAERSKDAPGPVLYVGRLMPHKGVNDLVMAVPPEMPLEILGRPYDAAFQRDLVRMAAGKDVTFRHACSDEELVLAYQRARCVVLPSVYRNMYGAETRVPELLGQTLLEGMSSGLPAIATNVASLPEVVEDGVTGFVVPPNDPAAIRAKLLWLEAHPDRAVAMGEAGRQRVLALFRWETVVERCLAIYGGGVT
jgi:glycosyltransferase involved in cell wall biosynthesis